MRVALTLLAMVCAVPLTAQVKPTFASDVAPILFEKCAPCHRPEGSAPFALSTYDDVRRHARQIAAVTRSRYMPPWLPQQGYGDFANESQLNEAEIQTLGRWVALGAPKGDWNNAQSPTQVTSGWALGTPDAVVQAKQPYVIPASGTDVFWNFVLTPALAKSHWIRAIEIRPSNAKHIHHANAIVDRLGAIQEGFPGMEVTVPRGALDFDGHFLFFKPGSSFFAEPDGFAWRLDPGSSLILNTHMQPNGKPETEQPTVALYFTDKRPTHFPYLLELQHDDALEIPARARDFLVSDDFTLPIDTKLLAIYPHAHYLGKVLEAYATLPDGKRRWLIRIPEWDPNWQSVYRYREPVVLPAGSVVSMRYHYDNSPANPRNPNRPPKRVEGGNRASDEMAHLWLQIMPASARESRSIYAEAWAKHELSKNPASYAANITLGSLALARFDAVSAVEPLRKAVALQEKDAIAHNLYGSALAATGRNNEACEQFEIALRLQPDLLNARLQLARALVHSGRTAEAVSNLQQILQRSPNDAAAKQFLEQLSSPPLK